MRGDDGVFDCDACGATMRQVPPPPPPRRAWAWFNDGRRPRGQVDLACPACGAGASVGTYSMRASSLRGRLMHLHLHRTLEPVPRLYATVGAAGALVGAVGARVASRPRWRWLVPLLALVVAWAVMATSGIWNPLPDD